MPVDLTEKLDDLIFQREVYANSFLTRAYWTIRDRWIFSFIAAEHRKLIDIGCGEGITLEKLVRRFPDHEVLGLDLSDDNLAICEQHNLPVRRSNVYDLQLEDDSSDCCLLLDVIEHLDDPRKAVSEIHRVLRRGGRAVIMFPNDRTFRIARLLTGKWKEARYDYGHVRQWTPMDMRQMLTGVGLTPIGHKSIPMLVWPLSLHHIVVAEKH
jgi:ubiquinone/menaquinone biosynthesis C-methylase UbiE